MKLAIDVQYDGNSAVVAGVMFDDWQSDSIHSTHLTEVEGIADYEPGAFYKRELPCILALLAELEQQPDIIIIDGFVTLGADQRPGLGMYLYNALKQNIAVIGVAKRPFRDTPENNEVSRGGSDKPLLVTAAGVELEQAKSWIMNMAGKYRNPTLLKRADQLCRGIE